MGTSAHRHLLTRRHCSWAQAARGLGKTLRSFAPTIQELTSVSRDLKNTLDEELGIDEIRREFASARVCARCP